MQDFQAGVVRGSPDHARTSIDDKDDNWKDSIQEQLERLQDNLAQGQVTPL